MIYVLELPDDQPPRAWFAFDADDLQRKLAAEGGPPGCALQLWADEAAAVAAWEDDGLPLWQGAGWKARHALHAQLVATDALADA